MSARPETQTKARAKTVTRRAGRGPFRTRNVRWFAGAFAVLLFCTTLAQMQEPPANANSRPPFLSAAWWRTPVERNPAARLPVVQSDLRDAFLLPHSDKLWVVGTGGLILHTADGGRSWKQQVPDWTEPGPRIPAAGALEQAPGGFALSTPVYASERGPEKGRKAAPGSKDSTASDYTQPLPAVKTPQSTVRDSLYGRHLNSVYFADAKRGWAVGNAGLILATTDGGQTWSRQNAHTETDLHNIVIGTDGAGLAVGSASTVLSTHDGGANWQTEMSATNALSDFYAIASLGNSRYKLAGRGFTDFTLSQPGTALSGLALDLRQQASKQAPNAFLSGRQSLGNIYAMQFLKATTGWAVGSFGTVQNTTDGGQTWTVRSDTLRDMLTSVCFVNDSTGWVTSWLGKLFKTNNRGRTWRAKPTGTGQTLRAVQFQDAQHGWVVGHHGTLLATIDGGETWFSQTRSGDAPAGGYARYPAPWYYLSLLLVALLLAPAMRKPEPATNDDELVQESVADRLISDRPLEIDDPDPLDFKAIAFGLSRFLRNEKTLPPLTIAITGKWGSGKSSLMNLLRADLLRNQFQSVWFNAWHHQKEEHLLAALLENVKAQAIPPWYSWHNLRFRYKLFKTRLQRNWPVFVGLFLLYSTLVGFLMANPELLRSQGLLLQWLKTQQPLASIVSGGALLAAATTLLGSFGLLWRGVRAFGLKPARLMASMSGRFSLRDFTAQAGFRYKFEKEFREVTGALSPHNLVILIDDLDRCRPDNVLEVLEAVNFLVASGSCFVVMGLDLDRVERCVGLGFKDVAEELLDEQAAAGNAGNGHVADGDAGRLRRAEFARQYLEKLINIEVPVPEPTPEQTEKLLLDEESRHPQALAARLSALLQPVRAVWPALLVATTLLAGYWFGSNERVDHWLRRQSSNQAQLANEAATSAGQPVGAAQGADLNGPGAVGRFEPGASPPNLRLNYWLPLALLALGIFRAVTLQPDVIVKDSPEFQSALRVWQPFIYSRQNTPRSIKRFMNRIRYFAMRLPHNEPQTPANPLLSRFKKWLRLAGEAPEVSTQKSGMREATLVALGALQNYNHLWLEKKEFWDEIQHGRLPKSDNSGDKTMLTALQKAIKEHRDTFKSWPPTEADVDELLSLSEGIRVA